QPPPGFIALFNGKDLANWQRLGLEPPQRAKASVQEIARAQAEADESMRQHWSVQDGGLTYDGKGKSVQTTHWHRNFKPLVDWKIGPKGDSGIYLRGSPQVQIWDNPLGSGGLYNNEHNPKDPTVVADKPVGEWNHFRIVMKGDGVSVWLNGRQVADNVVLE